MSRNFDVKKMVLTSALMAIVIVLQLLASVVKVGTFQISLVLIPISIGAILLGPKVGALLGFLFGAIVIITGDAAFFMSYGAIATVVIVLSKGTIAGYVSGLIYILFKNKTMGSIIAAFVAPVVNTSIFIIGTILFLQPALTFAAGGSNGITYLFTVMIGLNFLVELGVTTILSPAIKRICDIGFKTT